MKQPALRRAILLSFITMAAPGWVTSPALAAWPFEARGSFERTLTVTGPVELEVKTGSGNLAVRPGETGRVLVRGEIRARGDEAEEKVNRLEANPPIEQDGNRIRIGYLEDREDLRKNISLSYELVVPLTTRLKARTGSGNQSIEGIRGPVEADAGSGNVKIADIGGDVQADTGSGNIELTDIRGRVTADAGSGSIRAIGIAGSFRGDTGSGSVHVEFTTPGTVAVDTGSGSVELRGVRGALEVETGSGDIDVEGIPDGGWKLQTGSGDVRVRLPAEFGFEFDARTGSGRIRTGHRVTVHGSLQRKAVRGTVHGGGPKLTVRTGSGDIRLE